MVPANTNATAIGAMSATSGVTTFLSTFVASYLEAITGASTIDGILPLLSIVALVGGILSLVLTIKKQ